MAKQLDLEEQEQLDQIKHFWKQYGNAITWALIAILTAFASWNFYNYWQRSQANQAAALFDEVERSIQSGDTTKIDRVFSDMKERFAATSYAQQSGLLAAQHFFKAGKPDAAKAALTWVAEKSSDTGYQAVAKLRLAGILMDAKDLDGALGQLGGKFPTGFEALVADRTGDILALQGNTPKAIDQYLIAYKSFEPSSEYRRLVEVKLNALGVDVEGIAPVDTAQGK
ncbi:YfgM family protein [Rhodoferax antarcticus]|uniref:YfgM family protein n=1 Tax=Rhodoferax antarcticus TaxID=81479 RepID=UPI0022248063|nr:tetratricopeptide repeat protein [Rhodoferax antarcticus]